MGRGGMTGGGSFDSLYSRELEKNSVILGVILGCYLFHKAVISTVISYICDALGDAKTQKRGVYLRFKRR